MRLIALMAYQQPEKKKITRCVTFGEIGLNIFIVIKRLNFVFSKVASNNEVTEKVRIFFRVLWKFSYFKEN
jgi:hypothetical protein